MPAGVGGKLCAGALGVGCVRESCDSDNKTGEGLAHAPACAAGGRRRPAGRLSRRIGDKHPPPCATPCSLLVRDASCLSRAEHVCAQDEDSGDDDDDEAGAGAAEEGAAAAAAQAAQAAADAAKAAPKRKLPSALDALSSGGTKPSFLQAGKDSEFEVVELKERRLAPPEPAEEPPPLAPPLKKPRDASTPQVRAQRTDLAGRRPRCAWRPGSGFPVHAFTLACRGAACDGLPRAQISAAPAPPSRPAGGAAASSAASKKKQVDVKEKVKNQRVKGQTLGVLRCAEAFACAEGRACRGAAGPRPGPPAVATCALCERRQPRPCLGVRSAP